MTFSLSLVLSLSLTLPLSLSLSLSLSHQKGKPSVFGLIQFNLASSSPLFFFLSETDEELSIFPRVKINIMKNVALAEWLRLF